MEKVYQNKNVLEAFNDRMDFIFREFKNIYVAFSGGKDSGVLLNLVIKYMDDHQIIRPVGVYHLDYEIQYQAISDYVANTFASLPTYFEKFWCCLPFISHNAMSQNLPYWRPWDPSKKHLWIRPMPDQAYRLDNSPFFDYSLDAVKIRGAFAHWYHGQRAGRTVCLLGLRADESLSRYNSIINKKRHYNGCKWTTCKYKDIYTAAPLYDWTTADIWTANAKFSFPYNQLYDLMYLAGVPLSKMRISSSFHEWAGSSLKLYKTLDPFTWDKIVQRMSGANFGAIYGDTTAMGKGMELPAGYTWETYADFLLSTLPADIREIYTSATCSPKTLCHRILRNDHLGRAVKKKAPKKNIDAMKAKYAAIARGR